MNLPPITPEMLATIGITLAALVLFVLDRLPIEGAGLLVMVALMLTGVVTPAEGVSGFASEAIVTIVPMLVLSAALVRTGGVDVLGRWISRAAGGSGVHLLVVSIALVGPASAAAFTSTPTGASRSSTAMIAFLAASSSTRSRGSRTPTSSPTNASQPS